MCSLLVPECSVCGKINSFFVMKHNDFPNSSIYHCYNCNHWFTEPEPSHQEIEKYYRNVYAVQRKKYFSETYFKIMEKRAMAQISFIESHFGCESSNRFDGVKVLDWGCGIGALFHEFVQRGADVSGVDDDEEVIEIARSKYGVEVQKNLCEKTGAGQYDLIVISHALEHMLSVHETLSVILTFLRKGGLLFIEVPNTKSSIFSKKMDTESHLNFFSIQSLGLLLKNHQVEVFDLVACGPSMQTASNIAGNPFILFLKKTKIYRLIKRVQRLFVRHTFRNDRTRTVYDGYYEFYPENGDGMWLRCIGSKNLGENFS